MMDYIRFSKDYNINKLIPVTDSPYKHVDDWNKPYFTSMLRYDDNHYQNFLKNRSLAGMQGGKTDKIWADFDSVNDLQAAFKDAYVFCERLFKMGFKEENLQLSFSGSKGVGIIVELEEFLTIEQVKVLCLELSKELKTFDDKMYDHQRIFRLLFTKNEKTGLYKIPISLEELKIADITSIKVLAKDLNNFDKQEVLKFYKKATVKIPPLMLLADSEKQRVVTTKIDNLLQDKNEFHDKPREWRNCKWSLLQGNFEPTHRHMALTIIGATCKGLRYDRQMAYYMCKSAIKKQAAKYNQEEFSTDELWENILESIYAPTWQGGQYSCETDGWLHKYCQGLGHHACKKQDQTTVQIHAAFDLFKDYAENIDSLTIQTGIKELDDKVKLTIGMFVGVIGSPGSGKTSWAIQTLNNMSKRGELCLFHSLDMFHSLVIQKLVQKHLNMSSEQVFKRMQSKDPKFYDDVQQILQKEYANIEFCFESGQTVEQIQNTIKLVEEKRGKKVRLVVIDYNELIITEQNDSTASSAFVAQKLREIANKHNCCVVSLLQPSKVYSNPSDQINTYQAAKGSAALSAAVSVMLGISRPGYHADYPEEDKFMTITILKNRMGQLGKIDMSWSGMTGNLRSLTAEERGFLNEVKEKRKAEKDAKNSDWS